MTHRGWHARKTKEKMDKMKEDGKHLFSEGGGRYNSKMCWCGLYHRKVWEFVFPLKIGVVHRSNFRGK